MFFICYCGSALPPFDLFGLCNNKIKTVTKQGDVASRSWWRSKLWTLTTAWTVRVAPARASVGPRTQRRHRGPGASARPPSSGEFGEL